MRMMTMHSTRWSSRSARTATRLLDPLVLVFSSGQCRCRLEAPTGVVARVAASLFCVGKHATITPSPRCVGRWLSCTESPTAYGDRQPPSVTSPYSHRLSGRICRSICLSRVARFNSVTPHSSMHTHDLACPRGAAQLKSFPASNRAIL